MRGGLTSEGCHHQMTKVMRRARKLPEINRTQPSQRGLLIVNRLVMEGLSAIPSQTETPPGVPLDHEARNAAHDLVIHQDHLLLVILSSARILRNLAM